MDQVTAFFQGLHLPAGNEWVWAVCILGAAFLYGYMVHRDRSITILLSLYVSLAIVSRAPVIGTVNAWFHIPSSPTAMIVWFLAIFLVVYFLLWNSAMFHYLPSGRGIWWQATIMGLLQIGLAISIALMVMPAGSVSRLPPHLVLIFLNDAARSFWLCAPLIFVFFLRDELPRFDEDG